MALTAASNSPGSDDVKVVRRVLLFQVDLDTPAAKTAFGNAIGSAGLGKADIRINTPDDYDSPGSVLYWRNVLQSFSPDPSVDGYRKQYQTIFQAFTANLFANLGSLTLKRGRTLDGITSAPYIELSDFIVGPFEAYGVSLAELSNSLKLRVIHPQHMQDGKFKNVDLASSIFASATPRENDIIMVRTSYNDGPYELEYLGQIIKVNSRWQYGTVIGHDIDIGGLSKAFYTSQILNKIALSPQQFLPNIELNSVGDQSPYENRFNSKDSKGIFQAVLEEAMLSVSNTSFDQATTSAIKAGTSSTTTTGVPTDLYQLDPGFFGSTPQGGRGFQFDFFLFLGLYLMSITEAVGNLWVQGSIDSPPVLLDQPIRGLQEAGSYQVFLKMMAKGYSEFFSDLEFPYELLGAIRENAFMDVFETRNGIVICRPPRYNRIDLPAVTPRPSTDYNLARRSAESDQQTLQEIFAPGTDGVSGWVYNRNADFYIQSKDLVGSIDVISEEMDVETRIDTKWSLQLNGAVDIAAGSWTDPTLLVRYGFRSHAPVTNPNVLNPQAARLFSPIALAWANAKSRKVSLSVRDNRKYYIGRLYYIEALQMVGYLVFEGIPHGYEGVSQRTLTFSMVREVVNRSSADILSNPNEILNFAMCYCNDLTPSDVTSGTAAQAALIKRGTDLLNSMVTLYGQKTSGAPQATARAGTVSAPKISAQTPSVTVPMFKYLATILDFIVSVEETPALAEPIQQSQSNANLAGKSQAATAIRDSSGTLYAPFGLYAYPQIFDSFSSAISGNGRNSFLNDSETAESSAINYGAPSGQYVGQAETGFMQENPNKSNAGKPSFEGILAMSTPFKVDQFVKSSQNFGVSQLLINKLVTLDLNLKFQRLSGSRGIPGNIPQFFVSGPDSYYLFRIPPAGVTVDQTFLAAEWEPLWESLVVDNSWRLPPNILSFGVAPGDPEGTYSFFNSYYKIPRRQDGTFCMPMGYFTYLNPSQGWLFERLCNTSDGFKGGVIQFQGTPKSTNDFTFESVVAGQINQQTYSIFASGSARVYFVTPFAEPTIERLMEYRLPPERAGQYTNMDVSNLAALVKSEKGNAVLLQNNQAHTDGRAVDVSPDFLVAASRSDLTMIGSADWNSGKGPLPPLLQIFTQVILNSGFQQVSQPALHTPAPQSGTLAPNFYFTAPNFYFPIPNALQATVTDSSNKSNVVPIGLFHLAVSQAAVKNFVKNFWPPAAGSTNLYSPNAPASTTQPQAQDAVSPGTSGSSALQGFNQ